jgi:hypothetical protein
LASAVGTALRPGTPGRKVFGSIPFFGPVRVAEILAIMRTPFRFRTKRNRAKATRARLIRKVYAADPMECPQCASDYVCSS